MYDKYIYNFLEKVKFLHFMKNKFIIEQTKKERPFGSLFFACINVSLLVYLEAVPTIA